MIGKDIAEKGIKALTGRQARIALLAILEGDSLCLALDKAQGHKP